METDKQLETWNNKSETSNWRAKLWLYAPLVFWIGVIIFLGSGQGSMSRTSLFIRPLLEFLFPAASEETLQLYHGVIRKLAHFTEYGILAILALRAFSNIAARFVRDHFFAFSLLLVLIVAAIDEYQQSFQPTRTSSPYDVLIDVAGGAAVILLVWTVSALRHRKPDLSVRKND